MSGPRTVSSETPPISAAHASSQIGPLLHTLSNKLLPIVVFSELAIRRCEDMQLKPQLEKIHGAAEQARDLLVEIRSLHGGEKS